MAHTMHPKLFVQMYGLPRRIAHHFRSRTLADSVSVFLAYLTNDLSPIALKLTEIIERTVLLE